jgi:hypothetical protein
MFTGFHFVGIGFELSLNLNLFVYGLSRMEISAHQPKTFEFLQDLLTKKNEIRMRLSK